MVCSDTISERDHQAIGDAGHGRAILARGSLGHDRDHPGEAWLEVTGEALSLHAHLWMVGWHALRWDFILEIKDFFDTVDTA